MSIDYGWQKFFAAVGCLIGTEPIQKRLEYAATELIQLNPDDNLTPYTRLLWKAIVDELTRVAGPDGNIAATTQALSADEALGIARRILSAYDEICRNLEPLH